MSVCICVCVGGGVVPPYSYLALPPSCLPRLLILVLGNGKREVFHLPLPSQGAGSEVEWLGPLTSCQYCRWWLYPLHHSAGPAVTACTVCRWVAGARPVGKGSVLWATPWDRCSWVSLSRFLSGPVCFPQSVCFGYYQIPEGLQSRSHLPEHDGNDHLRKPGARVHVRQDQRLHCLTPEDRPAEGGQAGTPTAKERAPGSPCCFCVYYLNPLFCCVRTNLEGVKLQVGHLTVPRGACRGFGSC